MDMEIYLDNGATTKPFEDVIEHMSTVNKQIYGNPSSLHKMGIEAEKLIKKARKTISDSLSAENKEIIFTSGGTEANNLAIRGYLSANPRTGKHLITTKIEHPSVLEVYKYLEKNGYEVTYLDVDEKGVINLDYLKNAITENTALISIIHTNNETGTVQPVEEIVGIRDKTNRKIIIHVDAVQAYCKKKLNPGRTGIDLMSISAHKIHGPKGVGALYASKKIRVNPIMLGGGQEALLRSGTENVAGISGFGQACEIYTTKMKSKLDEIRKLNSKFRGLLIQNFDYIKINSPMDASPFILNVSFANLKAEVLLHHLEEKNIYVSTGSACTSRKSNQSHVLEAMGCNRDSLEGAIRFSFSIFNNEQECLKTIEALQEIVPKINIRTGGRK